MKKLIYFSLYFSEGAPIGFIWWALPAILSKQGFATTQIATISALAVLPWTFKFILGPIVDLLSMNKFKLKNQLLFYQVFMGLTLLFFETAITSKSETYILTILLIHGLFAALQDICIDSLAIKGLSTSELGSMNGIMQTGMLVGRSLFGGAGAYLAHYVGLKMTIYLLISSIWVSLIILQKSNFTQTEIVKIQASQYLKDFFNLIKNIKFWLLIGITYFATYSYNGISTIAGAILSEQGASALEYGITYGLLIPISMSAGAIIGGRYSDRFNPTNVLKCSLFITILSSIFVGFMIDQTVGIILLISTYILFYFFIGSTTATLYGLLMKNTSREFAALEFSLFMGVVNFSDSNTSYLTGQLIASFSTLQTTMIIGSVCMISLIFIQLFERKS